MSPLVVAAIVFACVFGAALGGMVARPLLPEHHRTRETEDAVKLGMGVIATMAALVVGLLLASAKSARDTKEDEVRAMAADLVLMDRNLARYGAETKDARDVLRRYTVYKIESTWGQKAFDSKSDGWKLLEEVQNRMLALEPRSDMQRWVRGRALEISGGLSRTRWLLNLDSAPAIRGPFLAIVVFWLSILFASFGMFAPRNGTMVMALLVSALSLTGAIFLIVDMSQPFTGVVRVSSAPMREALALLGQ